MDRSVNTSLAGMMCSVCRSKRQEAKVINSKSTNSKSPSKFEGNKFEGRGAGRPEARGGAKATKKDAPVRPGGKTLPGRKPPADEKYGIYRDSAPAPRAAFPPAAKAVTPSGGPSTATSDLAAALRALTAEVKALKNEAAHKDAEIKVLQKRLTQMEARQKVLEKAFRASAIPDEAPEEATEEASASEE